MFQTRTVTQPGYKNKDITAPLILFPFQLFELFPLCCISVVQPNMKLSTKDMNIFNIKKRGDSSLNEFLSTSTDSTELCVSVHHNKTI